MWNDPAESSALRRLLRAGREARSDYNVERGVVQHLANLQAGVPMPDWAAGLTAAKGASVPVLAWLAVPVLAATSLFGVWWHSQDVATPRPIVSGAPADIASARARTPMSPGFVVAASTEAVRPGQLQPSAAVAEEVAPRVDRAPVATTGAHAAARSQVRHPTASVEARAKAPQTVAVPSRDSVNLGEEVDVVPSAIGATASTLASSTPSRVAVTTPSVSGERDESEGASAERLALRTTQDRDEATEEPIQAPQPAHKEARPGAKPEPAVVLDDARLEREMQMLAVTQRVLAEDPARALRLARQGEHEFPRTMFSAERKQLALLALVGLGRVDEARRLGRPFLAAYPNAPWSARLERALATGRLPLP